MCNVELVLGRWNEVYDACAIPSNLSRAAFYHYDVPKKVSYHEGCVYIEDDEWRFSSSSHAETLEALEVFKSQYRLHYLNDPGPSGAP